MSRILRSPQSEEDLIDIWIHIAADNSSAADKLLLDIDAVCEYLSLYPLSGRNRDEIGHGLRSFPIRNYIVFYRPVDDGIITIRIIHGARYAQDLL